MSGFQIKVLHQNRKANIKATGKPAVEPTGLPALADIYSVATTCGVKFQSMTLWLTKQPTSVVKLAPPETTQDGQIAKVDAKGDLLCRPRVVYSYRKNNAYTLLRVPKRKRAGEPQSYREIHAPHPHLKEIQRRILSFILDLYQFEKEVTGFRHRYSIKDNAQVHAGGKHLVISLDIENFFPTITQRRIQQVFESLGYNDEISWVLSELCTYRGRLVQGAPTSPALANIVAAHTFETEICLLAQKFNFAYTRYADDLTFSTVEEISTTQAEAFVEQVSQVLLKHRFRLSTKKTKIMSSDKSRQMVTGLIVNNSSGSILSTWEGGKHPYDIRVPRKSYDIIRKVVYRCLVHGIGREYNRVRTEFSVENFINWLEGNLCFMRSIEVLYAGPNQEPCLSPRVAKLQANWDICREIWTHEQATVKPGILTEPDPQI